MIATLIILAKVRRDKGSDFGLFRVLHHFGELDGMSFFKHGGLNSQDQSRWRTSSVSRLIFFGVEIFSTVDGRDQFFFLCRDF
jgi:hypothetical protein